MKKVRVKITSSHQPGGVVEIEINKAKRLEAIGQVEILDGKQRIINKSEGDREDIEIPKPTFRTKKSQPIKND